MPPYLVLARKYRPATFNDVVGQDHVIKTLENSINSGRVGHAFLFCGVRGVGKTTVARILAKSLNCTDRAKDDANPCNKCVSCREISGGYSLDVIEIDGASNTSVENIREINENIKYPPVGSLYKIIIIDEVHMISINAFNALLKTLEEPPEHAKFIFATTESHKVPATINSRCQRFNFRTISSSDIASGLEKILIKEEIGADSESVYAIAREAKGSFRDALSLLDQVIAFSEGSITNDQVRSILGTEGRDSLPRLITMALEKDSAGVLSLVNELFHRGYDPDQFMIDLIQYLRDLIVVATIHDTAPLSSLIDVSQSELEDMRGVAATSSSLQLQNFFSLALKVESEIKKSLNPWVALEMFMLKMANASELVDLAKLIDKLNKLEKKSISGISSAAVPVIRESQIQKPAAGTSKTPGNYLKTESKGAPDEILPVHGASTETGKIKNDCHAPALSGTAIDLWTELKSGMKGRGLDGVLSLMDHGELVSYGPRMVEIGFTKQVFKEHFEESLKGKEELRNVFDSFFGKVQVKTLMLAQETSLRDQRPYDAIMDGQTDLDRAIRTEALENPVIRSVLQEFENSSVEEIRTLNTK